MLHSLRMVEVWVMGDMSADRYNSCRHQRYRIDQLESMVRHLVETIGRLEQQVKEQDQTITRLREQSESDGK